MTRISTPNIPLASPFLFPDGSQAGLLVPELSALPGGFCRVLLSTGGPPGLGSAGRAAPGSWDGDVPAVSTDPTPKRGRGEGGKTSVSLAVQRERAHLVDSCTLSVTGS